MSRPGDGEVVERAVDLGACELRMIVPRSSRAVLERSLLDRARSGGPGRDPALPYWARIWPSSVVLGRMLSAMDLRGRRVIELGAGLGVAGLSAAKAGGAVVLTDQEREPLRLAEKTARKNGLEVETKTLDWRKPMSVGRFGVVLAAETLYEPDLAEPLARVIAQLLEREGTALVADPWIPTHDQFVAAAESCDLIVSRRLMEFKHEGAALTTVIMEIRHC